jgi:hypothetical protein
MKTLLKDEVLLTVLFSVVVLEAIFKSPWLHVAGAIPMVTFLIRTGQWLRDEQAKVDRLQAELEQMIAEINLNAENANQLREGFGLAEPDDQPD